MNNCCKDFFEIHGLQGNLNIPYQYCPYCGRKLTEKEFAVYNCEENKMTSQVREILWKFHKELNEQQKSGRSAREGNAEIFAHYISQLAEVICDWKEIAAILNVHLTIVDTGKKWDNHIPRISKAICEYLQKKIK